MQHEMLEFVLNKILGVKICRDWVITVVPGVHYFKVRDKGS